MTSQKRHPQLLDDGFSTKKRLVRGLFLGLAWAIAVCLTAGAVIFMRVHR